MADKDDLVDPLIGQPSTNKYNSQEAKEAWPQIDDDEALANLHAYKEWMLAKGSWISEREDVERAFDIIEKDIPVSVGANGDVEDLVVGPALLKCFWCNTWTWSCFAIILVICFVFMPANEQGLCDYPTSEPWLGVAVFGVFVTCTVRAMMLEYQGAMYVLPSQAISSGKKLREMKQKIDSGEKTEADYSRYWHRVTFNEWLVGMLIISFLFHLDIASTAIFIARVLKSSWFYCDQLDKIWQTAIQKSNFFVKNSFMSWDYSTLVGLGTIVMGIQLLYAMSYSVPVSPNLSPDTWNEADKTLRWSNCWLAPYRWCQYQMADVGSHEILDHPAYHAGKVIGDEGDWARKKKEHEYDQSKRLLDDCMLLEDAYPNEPRPDKHSRVNGWLVRLQKENKKNDDYEMRLARHRRARVAIFNSIFKNDMGYGRAIQALVESGRMNLMQWQDDLYLEQSEHNWGPWAMVKEIRRTNIRFFLFALQAAFFPFFQITYFGIVANHADDANAGFVNSLSNFATAASVIVGTIIGMKYLAYEVKSVYNHRKFFNVAIEEFEKDAVSCKSQRKQWEVVRLRRRKNVSFIINIALFIFFLLVYIELMVKVVMVLLVCHSGEKVFNVPSSLNLMSGCQPIPEGTGCKKPFDTQPWPVIWQYFDQSSTAHWKQR